MVRECNGLGQIAKEFSIFKAYSKDKMFCKILRATVEPRYDGNSRYNGFFMMAQVLAQLCSILAITELWQKWRRWPENQSYGDSTAHISEEKLLRRSSLTSEKVFFN